MPVYRIYSLNAEFKIAAPPQDIHCDDDASAVELAVEMLGQENVEIWDGIRLVSKIPKRGAHTEWLH